MTWQMTQSGTSFSGTLTMSDTSKSGPSGTGTVSGSVSGTTLQFSLAVPAGGFTGAFAACTATLSGQATVLDSASITGTYSGSGSCSGAVSSGVVTLTKQ